MAGNKNRRPKGSGKSAEKVSGKSRSPNEHAVKPRIPEQINGSSGKEETNGNPIFTGEEPGNSRGKASKCKVAPSLKQTNEAHLNEAHVNGAHVNEAHLNEVHVNEVHVNEAHVNEVHANEVHVNEMIPLQQSWTLRVKSKTENFGAQRQVNSFDTVQDFWSTVNYIKAANELTLGSDYSLFKQGIEPTWEDPFNTDGGRWIFTLYKNRGFNQQTNIEKYWLETMLMLIGETIKEDVVEYVVGAVVSLRPRWNRVALWTTTCEKEPVISIGKQFKQHLKLPEKWNIGFQTHSDAQLQNNSQWTAIYTA